MVWSRCFKNMYTRYKKNSGNNNKIIFECARFEEADLEIIICYLLPLHFAEICLYDFIRTLFYYKNKIYYANLSLTSLDMT